MSTEPIRENHRVELKRELNAEPMPMPMPMIERLFAHRTRNPMGKIKAHRHTLSFEQLRKDCEEKHKPLGGQFKTNTELENKTASTLTAKERIDVRLWNPVALREAVINAIVHNDYSRLQQYRLTAQGKALLQASTRKAKDTAWS